MKDERPYPVAAAILFPILIALLLKLAPLPLDFTASLQQAHLAANGQQAVNRAKAMETAVSYFPTRGDMWEQAGNSYLMAGNLADAIRCFEKALNLTSLSKAGWLALGDTQSKAEDIKGAIETWSQMLRAGIADSEVYPRLLNAYVSQKDDQAAAQILNAWDGWGPESTRDIYHLGLSLSLSQPEEALPVLTYAAKLDSSLEPSVRIIQAGINSSAVSDPFSYRLLLIGRGLASLGEWELANTAFLKATQLSPDYAEAWAYLSQSQEQLKQDPLQALNKAVSLKPDSSLIQAFQALYWEYHGKTDLALVYLHAIAAKEPANGMWQVEIGNALVMMGDLMSALPYFQQAITIEPSNPYYWRYLAQFSLANNVQVAETGLPAARQAVALDSTNPDGLDILGQYMLAGKDLSSAERMFLKAIDQAPENAQAQFHLGLTYLEEGKRQPAYQALELALSLVSGQPLAEQIQRVLNQNFP